MNAPAISRRLLSARARRMVRSFTAFAAHGMGIRLRPYQLAPVEGILRSIDQGMGHSIVIVFPRQSGKDELVTCLLAYLMALFSTHESSIVMVNPTYRPQTINALLRLETRMNMNPITHARWSKRADYIRANGLCRALFLSGDGQANVVGATASLLLVVNEAQDIQPQVYDRNFAPMCASTNATRLFCGTVWTGSTLLGREMRTARRMEELDDIRRLYMVDADEVARVHAPYREHVRGQVAALGRQNPLVRTQYFNEEIDAQVGMFTPGRLALMQGDQPARQMPVPGRTYAMLIDVAGQDEAVLSPDGMTNPGRDSTTVSIVEVDLGSMSTLQAPIYRVMHRLAWLGENHVTLFGRLKALADAWKPQYIVIDATGVGEGLWAMLERSYGSRVLPVKFSQQLKSEIGWRFLAIIETGRFRDCAPEDGVRAQYAACQSEILPGPGKTLRWGVRQGMRSVDGELIHDDHVLADSLVAVLDRLKWSVSTPIVVIPPGRDFIDELQKATFGG